MAKQTYQVSLPADAQNQAFPTGLRQQLESSLPYYQKQASATSYYEDHPYKAMLRGVLGGAGINALFMPDMVEQAANERRAKAVQDFNTFYKNAIENQKNLDGITQPRNEALYQQSLTDEGKRQGLIQPTVPDLYQRDLPGMDGTPAQQPNVPVYSREFMDSMRKGIFGGSDINYLNSMQNYNRQLNYNMPSNSLGGMGTNNNGTTLQAGAKMQASDLQPPAAPFFISDPQTIMQQMTSAGNNAFDAGQKRYEFDQQEPNRVAEVKKLLSEGKATDALTILRKAQTGDATASASLKNRTNPNLRSGGRSLSMLEAMSPEQRQAYLNKQSGLSSGPVSVNDAYQRAGLEQQAGEVDFWTGKPTARAQIAQRALQTLGGTSAGFNSQFQSAPSAKPGKGKTANNGQSKYTTLSSGIKAVTE